MSWRERATRSRRGRPTSAQQRLRTTSPMFDAVVVRSETVLHTPQNSLCPAAGSDLAVNRADVGLHSVGAEVRQGRDLGIAFALGDEREDLRLSIAEAFTSTRPIKPYGAARPRWSVTY